MVIYSVKFSRLRESYGGPPMVRYFETMDDALKAIDDESQLGLRRPDVDPESILESHRFNDAVELCKWLNDKTKLRMDWA